LKCCDRLAGALYTSVFCYINQVSTETKVPSAADYVGI